MSPRSTGATRATSPRPSEERSNRGPLIVGAIAVALVVLVGIVVLVVSGGDDGGGDAGGASGGGVDVAAVVQETGPVSVEGDALPRFPENASGVIFGAADPAFGDPLPTITGEGFDGREVRISPEDGAQVIMVVAHWCPHCQAEVPRVVKWLRDQPLPDGVRLVTVSTAVDATRPNHPASRWLANERLASPVLADSGEYEAYIALGGGGFPYFVFVDGEGTVHSRATGELDERTFRGQVAGIAP